MIDEKSVTGTAVVIGAGTMGGGIAAQLANAGWQVKLLDVSDPDPAGEANRNSAAAAGLERVVKARPPLLFQPGYADRIEAGNTFDHLDWLREADWVVEAVAERMDVKQAVLADIEANVGSRTVVTSNTSGLSLRVISDGRSADFRSRFLGSHFMNPPRYLKLLEVIPLPETDPEVAAGFVRFAEQVLGHLVVIARDTPGFISTRIWIQHLVSTIRIALEQGLTVEEADYLTGTLLGRPNSATFRMADLVGLDIVGAIAGNQYTSLAQDPFRETLQLPDVVQRLIAEGHLGDKTGAGFYKRDGKAVLALDPGSGEYRPRDEVHMDEVEALLKLPLPERLPMFNAGRDTKWGRLVNAVLDSLNSYVEYAGPLIASDTFSVDNVMRWGFRWELGPFELQDLRTGPNRF
jgi:3-hydroxyacyl-CoA dehydrogenase